MQHGDLPEGLKLHRTLDHLDAETVPAGLLRGHRVADGVWGLLRVAFGEVTFVWEERPDEPLLIGPEDTVVIPPGVLHHVELGSGARFSLELHR